MFSRLYDRRENIAKCESRPIVPRMLIFQVNYNIIYRLIAHFLQASVPLSAGPPPPSPSSLLFIWRRLIRYIITLRLPYFSKIRAEGACGKVAGPTRHAVDSSLVAATTGAPLRFVFHINYFIYLYNL